MIQIQYAGRWWARLLLLLVLLLSMTSVYAQSSPTYEDIQYVPDGSPVQVLNIYLPEDGEGPFPVILEFHNRGGIPGGPYYMRDHVLAQGYAIVGVDYHDTSNWQLGVSDAFCALAWVHTEGAAYNLDMTRIVAFGQSLGGMMVAYLGTVGDPTMFLEDCPHTIDEEMPLRGVIDMGAGSVHLGYSDGALANFSGFSEAEAAAMKALIEPIPVNEWADTLTGDELLFASWLPEFWIDGTEPPILLVHGEDDEVVPAESSIDFAEALEEAGSPVELLLLEIYGHTNLVGRFSPESAAEVTEAVDAFLATAFAVDEGDHDGS